MHSAGRPDNIVPWEAPSNPPGEAHSCQPSSPRGSRYGTLDVLIPSWERSLRATNKSPKTIRSYGDSARLFETFARESFGITAVDRITRETVESFVEDQLARWKPATAAVRYRSLQQLMKWLCEEGEITVEPNGEDAPPDRSRGRRADHPG